MGGDQLLSLIVIDEGRGIPKDRHQSIIENFEQADQNTFLKYGGTGLGLAITKKLVDILGGKIFLISQIDKGSTFNVSIPYNSATRYLYLCNTNR